MIPLFRPGSLFLASSLFMACGEKEVGIAGTATSAEASKPSHPWDFVPADPELLAGRETYLSECALCHNEGDESSPALSDRSQWQTRQAKGLETLFKHAVNGFIGEDGEMPARGGTETLSDTEVEQAVRYMLSTQDPT